MCADYAESTSAVTAPPRQPISPRLVRKASSKEQHADQEWEEDLADCIAAWQESGRSQWSRGFDFRGPGSRGSSSTAPQFYGPQDPCGPVLSINVGGKVFRTTAATLRKAPFFDILLRHAEDGEMSTTFDDSGRFFVDRSPDLFIYIIEYLRSGHWILRDKAGDMEFVNALRQEASFYGLDPFRDRLPLPRISEYVTVWQFRDDTSLYVDCLEQTIREDPDHQGLFRLCKYSGGLPLDQQTCTKRFRATSHSVQSVIAYFAMRGFGLQHVMEGSMITHTTSADGQSRTGQGTQYVLSRQTAFPVPWGATATGAEAVGVPGGDRAEGVESHLPAGCAYSSEMCSPPHAVHGSSPPGAAMSPRREADF